MLITGRTHQLRVHCDHIGHTIVGDYTYSLRQDQKPDRMMLHSHRLISDMNIESLNITAPDPFVIESLPEWTEGEERMSFDDAVSFAEQFDAGGKDERVRFVNWDSKKLQETAWSEKT